MKKSKSMYLQFPDSSMYPLLHEKDLLYYISTLFSSIKNNDIIIVKKKNQIFAHRVIYKTINYCITQADATNLIDGKIYPKEILGIGKEIERNKKKFSIDTLYFLQSSVYLLEITVLTQAFNEAHVDFVILKGLPLHLYYEHTYPKRIYADCDILIDRTDFLKVQKIFKQLGYTKKPSQLSLIEQQKGKSDYEISFTKMINGYLVVFDLHLECVFLMTTRELNPLYNTSLNSELTRELLTHKRIITYRKMNFPILDKNYLFIYLCLHLFHHNFSGTYRYELLKKITQNLDYDEILRILQEFKLFHFIYPVLVQLQKYYDIKFPSQFILSQNKISPIQKYLLKRINIFTISHSQIKLFIYIFFFSETPFYKKVLVFLNKEILYLSFHGVFLYILRKQNLIGNKCMI